MVLVTEQIKTCVLNVFHQNITRRLGHNHALIPHVVLVKEDLNRIILLRDVRRVFLENTVMTLSMRIVRIVMCANTRVT